MARSTDLDYLMELVGDIQRQLGMTFRQARVDEFKKGKIRLWLDDKQDQTGSGSSTSSTGGASTNGGSGSGSGDGEWKSPWMWGAETHFGNAREDIPYKKGQNVLVVAPGGDMAQAFVLPGPPSNKQKLPVHQDDKAHTYQTEKFKTRRTVDGKSYSFWQDDQKEEDNQSQQGASSTSGTTGGQQSTQQQQQAKILNMFDMDEEGGITITSAKGIKLQIKDGGHDGGTGKESGKLKQTAGGTSQGKVSTLTVTPTGAKWEVEESGTKTIWEMTKEKVTQKVGDGQTVEWSKDQTTTKEGKIYHDDKNVGKTHKHGQVQPGGGKTGDPEAE